MPRGDTLWKRLETARLPELHKIGEIIGLRECKEKSRDALIEELSRELRTAAGHFVRNIFRGEHDFPYKQMLIDVADKMAPGWTFLSRTGYKLHDSHSEVEIEETIWQFFGKRIAPKIDKLSPEQREELRQKVEQELKTYGYNTALITNIGSALLSGAAAGLIGPALAYSIAWSTTSGLGLLWLWWVGPSPFLIIGVPSVLFILGYAPALLWWLGNTAYRKTIPATLYLIQIRKLRECEESLG